jgi:acyl-CoA thioesterase-1
MSIRILIGLTFALGCAADAPRKTTDSAGVKVSSAVVTPSARVSASGVSANSASSAISVLFFGTSLTAGYGLDPSLAFPNLIARKSQSTATPIVAINAGLSGETSAGAVRRIEWTLKKPVDIVVLETGGNDALRALDPDSLEANIDAIVSRIKKTQPQARILLVTMESPPNLGARYNARFRQAYSNVAKRENLTLAPFLLDKVAGKPELNQGDGVHPNERGEKIVADNVWKALEPVVREVYSKRPKA